METLSNVIRVSLPKYFAGLPVPSSVSGIFHLSLSEWISLTPLTLFVVGTTYLSYQALCGEGYTKRSFSGSSGSGGNKKPKVNEKVDKDSPKVVHNFDIEDIGEKKVFCRCWRSSKFPMCDGSHTKHNEETGDNVGPLIICKKK